jgi:hypothetical protein
VKEEEKKKEEKKKKEKKKKATVKGDNGVSSVHFPCYQVITGVSCRAFMYATEQTNTL